MGSYTEDHLIEQPAIQLLEHELGWDSVNAYDEWVSGTSSLGREAKREVVLTGRLKPALQSLNPELPAEALDAAVEELTRDRSALSLVEANREIDKLLRGGVKVKIPDKERGGQRTEVVQVIDWEILPAGSGIFPGFRRNRARIARSAVRRFHRMVKMLISVKSGPMFTETSLFA